MSTASHASLPNEPILPHAVEPLVDKVEQRGGRLPDYARLLAAYHQAYCGQLRAMLSSLPIATGDRWLDIACGDGAYTGWLSERVGSQGSVTAIDLSSVWLDVAQESVDECAASKRTAFCEADASRLPFADNGFDGVWCAQSLYSLPDAEAALDEMVRVTRPGGVVALLENDTLHHILLPWPVELELEVRLAELRAFAEESERPEKFYIGRQMATLLARAGLKHVVTQPQASIHQQPMTPDERTFLTEYLANLRRRAGPYLRAETLARLDRLVQPDSDEFLLDRADATAICLDLLIWGVKPGCT